MSVRSFNLRNLQYISQLKHYSSKMIHIVPSCEMAVVTWILDFDSSRIWQYLKANNVNCSSYIYIFFPSETIYNVVFEGKNRKKSCLGGEHEILTKDIILLESQMSFCMLYDSATYPAKVAARSTLSHSPCLGLLHCHSPSPSLSTHLSIAHPILRESLGFFGSSANCFY